jgi:hypothetical protein
MLRKTVSVLIILTLTAFLASCGGNNQAQTQTQTQTETQTEEQVQTQAPDAYAYVSAISGDYFMDGNVDSNRLQFDTDGTMTHVPHSPVYGIIVTYDYEIDGDMVIVDGLLYGYEPYILTIIDEDTLIDPDGDAFMRMAPDADDSEPDPEVSEYTGGYENLTQDQRLEILSYDSWDTSNPQMELLADVEDFLAWYVNDQYGLDISPEDVSEAIAAVADDVDRESGGELTLEDYSRLYHVCVYYELFPPQEARESDIVYLGDYEEDLSFGKSPQWAKGDTDKP